MTQKMLTIYSVIIGNLYIFYGMIQFLNGFSSWWLPIKLNIQIGYPIENIYIPYAVPDPFSGLVLLVTGATFLRGAGYLLKKDMGGLGYIFFAVILSGAIAVTNLLVTLAEWLDIYYPIIFNIEVRGEWSPLIVSRLISPSVTLFLPTLPLLKIYMIIRRILNEREVMERGSESFP